MKPIIPETKQKLVFIKSYPGFKEIERVLKIITKTKKNNLQVSILGKFTEENLSHRKKFFIAENELKMRCEKLFDYPTDFRVLSNPEIGTIFITEFLIPIFLQKIGNKTVGSISTGPYGVLRGLGINKERATFYLKALHKGEYLLIVRGYKDELNQIEDNLRELT